MKITALETYTHVRQAYLLIYFVCVVMYVFRCVSNEKKNTFSSRKMSFIFFIYQNNADQLYIHIILYILFLLDIIIIIISIGLFTAAIQGSEI